MAKEHRGTVYVAGLREGAFSWVSKPSQATTLTGTGSKHCSRTWAPYTLVKNRLTNGAAVLIL